MMNFVFPKPDFCAPTRAGGPPCDPLRPLPSWPVFCLEAIRHRDAVLSARNLMKVKDRHMVLPLRQYPAVSRSTP